MVAAVLLAIEFVADKIPYVDSVWDSVHTIVRPVVAAGVGALIATDTSGLEQVVAAAGTGAMALAWQYPWVAAGIALVLLVAGVSLAVFLVRRVRRGWARFRGWLRGQS